MRFRASGADDVVDFERQLELAQQAGDLLAGGDMAEARAGAERGLIEVVERGQSAWEELAVHHPFGEAVDRTETEPERQVVEAVGDKLLVARAEQRQTVADHNPVATRTVELAALAPGITHHLRIVALAGH